MLHVEPGEVVTAGKCACCGGEQRSTFGFVHSGEETMAFYYALLEPRHRSGQSASLIVSLGDWAREADPVTRSAATLRVKCEWNEIEMTFAEPTDSPYRDRAVLGQMLGREDVTKSVLRVRFLEVAQAIVLADPEVNEHLTRK